MGLIKKLSLKFGAKEGDSNLELEPIGITLFVGPNNSGKSLILREIEKCCAVFNKSNNLIIDDIEFSLPDLNKVHTDLNSRKTDPNKNENIPPGSILVQRINTYSGLKQREIIPFNQIEDWVKNKNYNAITRYYISLLTIRLDGTTRTTLLRQTNRGDLLTSPTNILAALFRDSESRKKIRNLTKEAFGAYFTIDALNAGNLRARLNKREPIDESEEQALDTRAIDYHRDSEEIMDASDGVKAFTGMVSTVLGQNSKILLIDEPEAFLYPPLAKRLGKELSETTSQRDANAFIATHSADFLMGCVSGNQKVNIVRLTYKGGKPTARLLHHERLQEIIKSPLMRSTGVLSALFHDGAIVCESDSDRALYREVNDRIETNEKEGFSNAIFLNAHSKQSTAKIAGPLREMGIPAAVVVDFDILKDNPDFKNLLKDLNIPQSLSKGWCQTKSSISKYCTNQSIDWNRKGILDIKDINMLISLKSLLTGLKEFGIFIVPNGELESWLGDIGVDSTNNKKYWLLKIFELLGGDPNQKGYIKPKNDDIWEFIRSISFWINNPDRSGI